MNGTQWLHAQYRQDVLRIAKLIGDLSRLGGDASRGVTLPRAEYLLARESKFTHKPVSQLVSEGLSVLDGEQESLNRFYQQPITEVSLSDPDVQAEVDAKVADLDAQAERDADWNSF